MSTKTDVATPSQREITVTRRFAATRDRVFDAFTRPELVRRWMHGPSGWRLETCEIDRQAGGAIRYEWKNDAGESMGMSGAFREVDAPARTVHTELFDEDWTGGETIVTTEFREDGDGTIVTITTRFVSREARDAALATGMADGMEQSFKELDAALAAES